MITQKTVAVVNMSTEFIVNISWIILCYSSLEKHFAVDRGDFVFELPVSLKARLTPADEVV